jgi:hypothetical protein
MLEMVLVLVSGGVILATEILVLSPPAYVLAEAQPCGLRSW